MKECNTFAPSFNKKALIFRNSYFYLSLLSAHSATLRHLAYYLAYYLADWKKDAKSNRNTILKKNGAP